MAFAKIMKTYITLSLLLTLFTLNSCSTVNFKEPLTSEDVPKSRKALEGIWSFQSYPFHVNFTSASEAKIAVLRWENGDYKIHEGKLKLAEWKSQKYMSIRFNQDDKSWSDYSIVKFDFSDDGDLIIWKPDVPKFSNLLKEMKLKGTVEKVDGHTSVLIDNSDESFKKLIAEKEINYFDYKKPLIFRKLPSPKF